MNNRRHFYIVWILLLLGSGLSGCGKDNDDDDAAQFSERAQRELRTTIGQLHQELDVPGMLVGLWVPGVGQWIQAYGVSNRATGEPMRFDQHVRISSVTKTFTVTLLLQLHDEGLLNIDDTLDRYFDTDPRSRRSGKSFAGRFRRRATDFYQRFPAGKRLSESLRIAPT
ncbi:MAG: beta-lactamase family protein [Candidatus Competibacteraceae bacterium]|nr:MAG: beta-lactamase family protein [Candidatus Competibacteraceae bacterium]